jgi:hypothetical protein
MRQYVARTRISGLRDQAVKQEARQFGAFLNRYRKSPVAHDCVVVDAAPIEPVSPCNLGNCREIFTKCREADVATWLKAIRSQ